VLEKDITLIQRVRFGLVFFWMYGFALLALVAAAQTLKYSIRRERPQMLPQTKRINAELRLKEEGTFSMPSGDSGAAAVFCYVYASTLLGSWIYLIVPLVALGRIYY
jgi:membrane-associated phospholipid phosphatase